MLWKLYLKNWKLKDCKKETLYHAQSIIKNIRIKHGEVFYQFYTARKTASDNQLIWKDIDVNEHKTI